MVTARRFEALVREAMDELPDWVQERLENVEMLVEEEPPAGGPELLGLYEGVPLTRRGIDYTWALPDRITLFRGPIERTAGGAGELGLRRVIVDTLVHEVAHFFGISEDRLRDLGRG